jgi:hypothetical protein
LGWISNTSDTIIVNNEASRSDQSDQDNQCEQLDHEMWMLNLEQEQLIYNQGVQDQGVHERRYPLRKMQLTKRLLP